MIGRYWCLRAYSREDGGGDLTERDVASLGELREARFDVRLTPVEVQKCPGVDAIRRLEGGPARVDRYYSVPMEAKNFSSSRSNIC